MTLLETYRLTERQQTTQNEAKQLSAAKPPNKTTQRC
jgi:hypothetical protein